MYVDNTVINIKQSDGKFDKLMQSC